MSFQFFTHTSHVEHHWEKGLFVILIFRCECCAMRSKERVLVDVEG